MLEVDKIYCGDCLELMKGMPDNSVSLVLTDPPYGHNNNNGDLISRWEAALGQGDYIPERDNRPIANDGIEAQEIFEGLILESGRILIPGGCCCCCCCGGGPDPMFARWSLFMDKVLEFKQMVVWDKGPMGMGWHYRRSYETILVAQKKGAACKWYDNSMRIENIIRHIPKIIPNANQHPTIKPVALMEHFIRLHTQQGDLILDPFIGSGTTAIAAIRLNRHYIGMEISAEYCQIAEERIRAEKAQLRLF